MSPSDTGTLYVLANRDHSLSKIGMTRNGTPDARASDYERQHGIQWHVYWSARTCNVAAAESAAHRDLQTQRFSLVPEAREIFHVTPARAVAVAQRYVVPPDDTQSEPHTAQSGWRTHLERAGAIVALLASLRGRPAATAVRGLHGALADALPALRLPPAWRVAAHRTAAIAVLIATAWPTLRRIHQRLRATLRL